jgi:hypothetical protein
MSRPILHRRGAVLAVVGTLWLAIGLSSCGTKEGPVDPSKRLCGGASDVGLLVQGGAGPEELCASSDSVSAILTTGPTYDVIVTFASAGTRYRLQMVMRQRNDWPVKLTVTSDPAEVSTNPDAVWIYYEEMPAGGPALESYVASGGSFTLSFSDADVAAGTLSGVSLILRQTDTSTDAGTRLVAEGFFTFATR